MNEYIRNATNLLLVPERKTKKNVDYNKLDKIAVNFFFCTHHLLRLKYIIEWLKTYMHFKVTLKFNKDFYTEVPKTSTIVTSNSNEYNWNATNLFLVPETNQKTLTIMNWTKLRLIFFCTHHLLRLKYTIEWLISNNFYTEIPKTSTIVTSKHLHIILALNIFPGVYWKLSRYI